LFNESAVEREMLAVDSEHSMYLQDDSARRRMIFQTLSNLDSAYNRFDTGSVESLKHDEIRAKLIKFH
jgi:secreted Zn-dependent insulinase-like peptidase